MFTKIINALFTIVLLVGLSVAVYVQRDNLLRGLQNLYNQAESMIYPACSRTISYRLGDFSDQFGISREEFLGALQEAEKVWEEPIGKNLFVYDAQGDLVVNLIYDNRQEITNTLKDLDNSLDRSRASYEIIKANYQQQVADYEQIKAQFEQAVQIYEVKRGVYEKQVSLLNKRGGADEMQYARLEQDRKELNQIVASLRNQQDRLQEQGQEVNALAMDLNARAIELNLAVDTYNTVGGSVGEEFDEGLYRVDETGKAIDVFQFDNRQQLIRLLAHEFGHALGIDHVEDPDAIMYRLNQSTDLNLASSDLEALTNACSI